MNQNETYSNSYNEETSLVDLAAVFIKRRKIFYLVFITIIFSGLIYALLQKNIYRYTSLIEVAEKKSGEYFEAPSTTIAILENRWLPKVEAEFREETSQRLSMPIKFMNPENTGLIRIYSDSTLDNKKYISDVHERLIHEVIKRQSDLLEREKKTLVSRIRSTKNTIEALKDSQDTSAIIADVLERQAELEDGLDGLKKPEVLVISRESSQKIGPPRALLMLITFAFGLVLGVVAAFFAEFIARVKVRVLEQKV